MLINNILKYFVFSLLFFLVAFLIIKISFSDLWRKNLLIGYYLSKFFSKFQLSKSFSIIIEARKVIENKFGSTNNIPIILVIGSTRVWESGLFIKTSFNEDIGWCINEKMCIMNIFTTDLHKIKTIEREINEVFLGKGFNSVILQIHPKQMEDKTVMLQKNILQSIFKESKIVCSVFLMIEGYGFHEGKIFDKFGIIDEQIRNFEESYLESIILDKNSEKVMDSLIDFKIIKDNLKKVIYNLNDIGIKGVFIGDKICSNSTFLNNEIYSECSNSYFKSSYSQFQLFLNGLRKLFILILCFSLVFSSYNHYKSYKSLREGLYTIENTPKLNEDLIGQIIKDIDTPSNLSKIFMGYESKKIEEILSFLVKYWEKTTKDYSKKQKIKLIDNPFTRKNFIPFKNKIENLLNIFKKTKFVKGDKYNKYIILVQEKIRKNFSEFHENFLNIKLLDRVKKFNGLVEKVLSNNHISKDTLVKIYKNIFSIKKYIKPSLNNWWINNKFDEEYELLLEQIKQTKGLEKIYIEILKEKKFYLEKLKDNLFSESLMGSLLSIKNNKLNSKLLNSILLEINKIKEFNSQDNSTIVCNEKQFLLWNIDELEKLFEEIVSMKELVGKNLETSVNLFLNKIINSAITSNIFNKILSCSKITDKSLFNLSQRSYNLKIANLLMEKIIKFSSDKEITNKTKDVLKEQMFQIENDILEEINKGILSSYKNLHNWNGKEHVVRFLFAVPPEETSYVVQQFIKNLDRLKKEVINNLFSVLTYIPEVDVKFLKYFKEQIEGYDKGEKNDLAYLEGFLKSLSQWKIEYLEDGEFLAQVKDFFQYHHQAFQKALLLQTQKIVLDKSNHSMNYLINFFNSRLSKKFPFGNSKNSVNLSDFIFFFKKYQEIKKDLLNDKNFLKQPGASQVMYYIDNLLECFDISGTKLLFNAQFICNDSSVRNATKNTNLISACNITTDGNDVSTNIISKQTSVQNSFSFEIKIANTSSFIIVPKTPESSKEFDLYKESDDYFVTTTNYGIKLKFTGFYSILRFISKFQFLREGKDIILKIEIPIYNSKSKIGDLIIAFVRVKNVPEFPPYLNEIN